ncbi:MAG: hypothetical protein ACYSW0_09855, partial [Planctomycetota bacterium]
MKKAEDEMLDSLARTGKLPDNRPLFKYFEDFLQPDNRKPFVNSNTLRIGDNLHDIGGGHQRMPRLLKAIEDNKDKLISGEITPQEFRLKNGSISQALLDELGLFARDPTTRGTATEIMKQKAGRAILRKYAARSNVQFTFPGMGILANSFPTTLKYWSGSIPIGKIGPQARLHRSLRRTEAEFEQVVVKGLDDALNSRRQLLDDTIGGTGLFEPVVRVANEPTIRVRRARVPDEQAAIDQILIDSRQNYEAAVDTLEPQDQMNAAREWYDAARASGDDADLEAARRALGEAIESGAEPTPDLLRFIPRTEGGLAIADDQIDFYQRELHGARQLRASLDVELEDLANRIRAGENVAENQARRNQVWRDRAELFLHQMMSAEALEDLGLVIRDEDLIRTSRIMADEAHRQGKIARNVFRGLIGDLADEGFAIQRPLPDELVVRTRGGVERARVIVNPERGGTPREAFVERIIRTGDEPLTLDEQTDMWRQIFERFPPIDRLNIQQARRRGADRDLWISRSDVMERVQRGPAGGVPPKVFMEAGTDQLPPGLGHLQQHVQRKQIGHNYPRAHATEETTTLGELAPGTFKFEELQRRSVPIGGAVRAKAVHGSLRGKLHTDVEGPEWNGIHFGTSRAAHDRLEGFGSGAPQTLHEADLDLRRTIGTFDDPLDDNIANNLLVDETVARKLRDDGFDAIVYRNDVEDAGSVSIAVLNPDVIQATANTARGGEFAGSFRIPLRALTATERLLLTNAKWRISDTTIPLDVVDEARAIITRVDGFERETAIVSAEAARRSAAIEFAFAEERVAKAREGPGIGGAGPASVEEQEALIARINELDETPLPQAAQPLQDAVDELEEARKALISSEVEMAELLSPQTLAIVEAADNVWGAQVRGDMLTAADGLSGYLRRTLLGGADKSREAMYVERNRLDAMWKQETRPLQLIVQQARHQLRQLDPAGLGYDTAQRIDTMAAGLGGNMIHDVHQLGGDLRALHNVKQQMIDSLRRAVPPSGLQRLNLTYLNVQSGVDVGGFLSAQELRDTMLEWATESIEVAPDLRARIALAGDAQLRALANSSLGNVVVPMRDADGRLVAVVGFGEEAAELQREGVGTIVSYITPQGDLNEAQLVDMLEQLGGAFPDVEAFHLEEAVIPKRLREQWGAMGLGSPLRPGISADKTQIASLVSIRDQIIATAGRGVGEPIPVDLPQLPAQFADWNAPVLYTRVVGDKQETILVKFANPVDRMLWEATKTKAYTGVAVERDATIAMEWVQRALGITQARAKQLRNVLLKKKVEKAISKGRFLGVGVEALYKLALNEALLSIGARGSVAQIAAAGAIDVVDRIPGQVKRIERAVGKLQSRVENLKPNQPLSAAVDPDAPIEVQNFQARVLAIMERTAGAGVGEAQDVAAAEAAGRVFQARASKAGAARMRLSVTPSHQTRSEGLLFPNQEFTKPALQDLNRLEKMIANTEEQLHRYGRDYQAARRITSEMVEADAALKEADAFYKGKIDELNKQIEEVHNGTLYRLVDSVTRTQLAFREVTRVGARLTLQGESVQQLRAVHENLIPIYKRAFHSEWTEKFDNLQKEFGEAIDPDDLRAAVIWHVFDISRREQAKTGMLIQEGNRLIELEQKIRQNQKYLRPDGSNVVLDSKEVKNAATALIETNTRYLDEMRDRGLVHYDFDPPWTYLPVTIEEGAVLAGRRSARELGRRSERLGGQERRVAVSQKFLMPRVTNQYKIARRDRTKIDPVTGKRGAVEIDPGTGRPVYDTIFAGQLHGSGTVRKSAHQVILGDTSHTFENSRLLHLENNPHLKKSGDLWDENPNQLGAEKMGERWLPGELDELQQGEFATDPFTLVANKEKYLAQVGDDYGGPIFQTDPLLIMTERSAQQMAAVAADNFRKLVAPQVRLMSQEQWNLLPRGRAANTKLMDGIDVRQIDRQLISDSKVALPMDEALGVEPEGFVQAWPEELASELESFAKTFRSDEVVNQMLKGVDAATSLWKKLVLYLPRWFIVNIIGSGILGVMAGSNPLNWPKLMAQFAPDLWRLHGLGKHAKIGKSGKELFSEKLVE